MVRNGSAQGIPPRAKDTGANSMSESQRSPEALTKWLREERTGSR
jgi:hypothetical protein